MAADSLSDLGAVAGQIQRAEAVVNDMKRDRDALIVELLAQGYSEREISRAAGVSSVRVHQIKKGA